MSAPEIMPPPGGEKISFRHGKLQVPDQPILPFVEGDGVGPDLWRASVRVLDAAVQRAYGSHRQLRWMQVYAGEQAFRLFGTGLPDATLAALREYRVGLTGPLSTPRGGGLRSLLVALRQRLDLYAGVRPVRYFRGLPAPVQHPERVDMVIFRETTEDIYAGIEFEAGSAGAHQLLGFLQAQFPKEYRKIRFPTTAALGVKPVSQEGSERLIRAALQYAVDHRRKSVTLVHKGNIMKYTEGAFRNWGYALAEREFAEQTYTWTQWERTKAQKGEAAANAEQEQELKSGKILIKDAIADITFQQTLTRGAEFDVIATTNLNGDYLSDAMAAQVGGIGIAPGGNINYQTGQALFEATHRTAPQDADRDQANPGSLILSGEMLLRYLGWTEAADRVLQGMEGAIGDRIVTYDLARLMEGASEVTTSQFGDAVIERMR